MKLRWYQEQAVSAIWDYLRETAPTARRAPDATAPCVPKAPCVVLPTGSGKTRVIAELCR